MSQTQELEFMQRLRRINRYHRKLANGSVTTMTEDGLLVARPSRKSSIMPLRGLFLCLVTLMLFKGFLFAQLGAEAYIDRVAILEAGTAIEKFGAFAMEADPLTIWLGEQIGGIFR